MAKIVIDKLEHEVLSKKFDCGNDSINRKIPESFFPTLMQYAYAYEVLHDTKVVGYYMVNIRTIRIEDGPDCISEYSSTLIDHFSVLHINYIAVDKRSQRNQIGTGIMRFIVSQAKELCKQAPITAITLDALKEKYDWYTNLGFIAFDDSELENDNPTITMYMICLIKPEDVNNYITQQERGNI